MSYFRYLVNYLRYLFRLTDGMFSVSTATRFALVGMAGVVLDSLLFQWFTQRGADLALAHIASFMVTASVNYVLNSKWSFHARHVGYLRWNQLYRFLTVGVLALFIRGGVLALGYHGLGMPLSLAIFPAIAVTALVNYMGSAFYVFSAGNEAVSADRRWQIASTGIVAFVLLLQLVYLGQAELMPDEAYYWNYSQHMALSFLDHPPMVAWLIWLGTGIFGDNEFGVRISAFACGLIAIGYLYAFSCNLYNKSTGIRAVLLLTILPFGFAASMLMTPDAPLVAAWMAALYYLERALIGGHRVAWVGVGIALGLGMLSKYTMGLLGVAALVFMALDPVSRRWLRHPYPYLAAVLALLFFLPVIVWNAQNEWASFLFQSVRRMATKNEFSVHVLVMQVLALLTPAGLFAAIVVLWCRPTSANPALSGDSAAIAARNKRFVLVFSLVPLSVFLAYSVTHSMRSHLFWNGPVWLAVLPSIAWMVGEASHEYCVQAKHFLQKAWKHTIAVMLLLYGVVLHYVVLGLPWMPYPDFVTDNYFWREASEEIEKVEAGLRLSSGKEPIIVGMNKFSAASELAFYDREHQSGNIRSRNLFGENAVMYDLWFPSQAPVSQPVILVGTRPQELERDMGGRPLDQWLYQLGPVQSRVIRRDGKIVRRVYYRIANGYLGKLV